MPFYIYDLITVI